MSLNRRLLRDQKPSHYYSLVANDKSDTDHHAEFLFRPVNRMRFRRCFSEETYLCRPSSLKIFPKDLVGSHYGIADDPYCKHSFTSLIFCTSSLHTVLTVCFLCTKYHLHSPNNFLNKLLAATQTEASLGVLCHHKFTQLLCFFMRGRLHLNTCCIFQ